jgi:ATP-dependent Clp protease adapter protein ClpS
MHKKPIYILEQLSKMQPGVAPLPVTIPDVDKEHFPGEGFRVTLFNDDTHSMDEVVEQLLKALRCEIDVAVNITLRAHTRGSATVIIADQDRADFVASVLREISLVVSVERV